MKITTSIKAEEIQRSFFEIPRFRK